MSYKNNNKSNLSKNKRRKKYKVKKLPVVILLITIISIIIVMVSIFNESDSDIKNENSSLNTSNVDSTTAGDSISSLESVPDADTSSTSPDESSEPISSDGISSQGESSEITSSEPTSSSTENTTDVGSVSVSDMLSGATAIPNWNMILLNKDNNISNEILFEKKKFDSQYVDARAGEWYQKMYDAAKADGIELFLRSGYRSIKTQESNYNAAIQRHISNGNSREEAIRLTDQYYTKPGHSEHHSGLAFDIITLEYHDEIYSLDDRFAKTKAYTWLIENCSDYGFILRYPQDKVSVTDINFEPWHYRYVGINHAKAIEKNNLCLEEYIDSMKQSFLSSSTATTEEEVRKEMETFSEEFAAMLQQQ